MSSAVAKALIDKELLEEKQEEMYRDPLAGRTFTPDTPLVLTDMQQAAIEPILEKVKEEKAETFLLHGITGSGKTEIYLQSISEVLKKDRKPLC